MIKRVLMATINYDHPQRGMEHAFKGVFGRENGQHVVTFDYLEKQRQGNPLSSINHAFIMTARNFNPDWIWLQLQDTEVIQPATLQQIRAELPRCIITHWTGDARSDISPYLKSICQATHMTLMSSVGQVPVFRAAGAPIARYLQIGVDWHEDVLGEPDWVPPFRVPDVVFCGGYYGELFPGTKDRAHAIRVLQNAGIDVGVVGPGWPAEFPSIGTCDVKQQHHVWKRAKVALSVNHFNELEQYYSDRQLISMASGTPVVCKRVPGMEREFKDNEHCLMYDDAGEMLNNVRRLLNDPLLRRKIGTAGRAEIIRNHTWFSRIMDLVPEIEALR